MVNLDGLCLDLYHNPQALLPISKFMKRRTKWTFLAFAATWIGIAVTGCGFGGSRSLSGKYEGDFKTPDNVLHVFADFEGSGTMRYGQGGFKDTAIYTIQDKQLVSEGRVIGEILDSRTIDFSRFGYHVLLKKTP